MASPLYFILALLVLLPQYKAASSPDCNHHHEKPRIRSFNFTLFQHEIVNKTVYTVVEGIGEPGTNSFGTFCAYEDPLKLTADPSSKTVGMVEGTTTSTSKQGMMYFVVSKTTLNLDSHNGSLSFVGSTHLTKPSEHAIVGGTGDFLFAQGIATSFPVKLEAPEYIYRLEFQVYWPPYAPSYAIETLHFE